MHIYNTRIGFSLNEIFLYTECPMPYLKMEVECTICNYLNIPRTHIETTWVVDKQFSRGVGAILKSISLEESDVPVDVVNKLENFKIHRFLKLQLKADGFFEDKPIEKEFIPKVDNNKYSKGFKSRVLYTILRNTKTLPPKVWFKEQELGTVFGIGPKGQQYIKENLDEFYTGLTSLWMELGNKGGLINV